MHRFFGTIILLWLLFGCGVKQPVDVTVKVKTGKIAVHSVPDSATIFLDGENTFRLTPDTLDNVSPGAHVVSVTKAGYQAENDSVVVTVKADSVATAFFSLQKLVLVGLVAVDSDPAGGEIYLDGQSTGQYTPDTLQVDPGTHMISIYKNGFQRDSFEVQVQADTILNINTRLSIAQRILMESFGNVSCQPCVNSAQNLERFIAEHPADDYVIFEYYANWPKPDDPFYRVSPQQVDERVIYYSVYSLPALRMNGAKEQDAQDYDGIVNAYQQLRVQQNTPLAISLNPVLRNDTLRLRVEWYDYQNVLANDQLRLFVAVIEDDIHFSSPPGANGLKDFNFVFRRFLTDKKGDLISGQDKEYIMAWPQDWSYDHCRFVAFIQDKATQKIYQTTIR